MMEYSITVKDAGGDEVARFRYAPKSGGGVARLRQILFCCLMAALTTCEKEGLKDCSIAVPNAIMDRVGKAMGKQMPAETIYGMRADWLPNSGMGERA